MPTKTHLRRCSSGEIICPAGVVALCLYTVLMCRKPSRGNVFTHRVWGSTNCGSFRDGPSIHCWGSVTVSKTLLAVSRFLGRRCSSWSVPLQLKFSGSALFPYLFLLVRILSWFRRLLRIDIVWFRALCAITSSW